MFSGVLFALKVLHNTYFPYGDEQFVGWFPVPTKYACWAELILIQLLTPNASFVGHLAGIIVGLAYTSGPLKLVVDLLSSVLIGGDGQPRHPQSRPRGTFQQGAQSTGYRRQPSRNPDYEGDEDDRPRYRGRDYAEYTGGMSEEEQYEEALRRSRQHPRSNEWNY